MPRYYVEMHSGPGGGCTLWDRQTSQYLARFQDVAIADRVAALLNAALEQGR